MIQPVQAKTSKSGLLMAPASNSRMASTKVARPSTTTASPVMGSSSISAVLSSPPVTGNNPPILANGGSNSRSAMIESVLMPASFSIVLSSGNVRTTSMSSSPYSALSCFLATHGPMKTTAKSGPYISFTTLAVATIGETMGAKDLTKCGA
ncbi:MAG: hypothetical protein BWX66_01067 [Deltaproteobacteria bacterium ADurb.Bin058]|nr:MAG: hypothetical protein BWX66_01067 [Deltaproteobacteria bacterium ADurb.Bin058]